MNFIEARELLRARGHDDKVYRAILTLFDWQHKTPEEKAREILSGLSLDGVAWLRLQSGEDSTGQRSWFFNVVLWDGACHPKVLADVTRAIGETIRQAIYTEIPDAPFCYFNWRAESEQRKTKSPDWEPPVSANGGKSNLQKPAEESVNA